VIPFGDLSRENAEIGAEVRAAVDGVLARGRFILGDEVAAFEREFAAWLGTPHAIGCASGTEAITLALLALDVGPGDEVIVPANTCVPTATGIRMTGATCVPVDVLPDTLMIDPAAVGRARTPRTKALVPVHLYGGPADLDPLLALGIPVVEDCAQAHGTRYRGRLAGTIGVVSCFSFYPSKNLGAYGDAGAVCTGDPRLAERLRRLRQYGQAGRYHHVEEGLNSRMDELQGAILRVKLRRLDAWNARRRAIAEKYRHELTGVTLVAVTPGGESVHHLFPVLTPRRDDVQSALAARGVETIVHYPTPLHLVPAYRSWGFGEGAFPVAEDAARRVLSLPIFPQLTDEEVRTVVTAVRELHA
jgi:dTDP-3-amino-3,4,6-trideoxy-alpha-D-glucose transaminase